MSRKEKRKYDFLVFKRNYRLLKEFARDENHFQNQYKKTIQDAFQIFN